MDIQCQKKRVWDITIILFYSWMLDIFSMNTFIQTKETNRMNANCISPFFNRRYPHHFEFFCDDFCNANNQQYHFQWKSLYVTIWDSFCLWSEFFTDFFSMCTHNIEILKRECNFRASVPFIATNTTRALPKINGRMNFESRMQSRCESIKLTSEW